MCMVPKLVAGILFEDIPMTLFQWVFRCSKTAGGFLKWECPYIIYFHGIFHYTSTILGCHHDYGSPHFFNWCLDWPAGPQWQWQESFFSHAQLGWFLVHKIPPESRLCSGSSRSKSRSSFFAARESRAALRTLALCSPANVGRGAKVAEVNGENFQIRMLCLHLHICCTRFICASGGVGTLARSEIGHQFQQTLPDALRRKGCWVF